MKTSTKSAFVAICAVAMSIPAISIGLAHGEPGGTDVAATAPAATEIMGLSSNGPAADVKFIRDALPTVVSGDTQAPVKSELNASGRTLFADGADSVVAAGTSTGDVCYMLTTAGRTYGASCTDRLLPAGVAFVASQRDAGWWVAGVAADGVTKVQIRTSAGELSSARIKPNAFVWSNTALSEVPVEVIVTRDGAKFVLSAADVSPS